MPHSYEGLPSRERVKPEIARCEPRSKAFVIKTKHDDNLFLWYNTRRCLASSSGGRRPLRRESKLAVRTYKTSTVTGSKHVTELGVESAAKRPMALRPRKLRATGGFQFFLVYHSRAGPSSPASGELCSSQYKHSVSLQVQQRPHIRWNHPSNVKSASSRRSLSLSV